jgi:DNA topoisomerase-1
MAANITRYRVGRGFKYFLRDREITDTETIDRIRSLTIPPAWQDVEVAVSPNAKILAYGTDTAGRKQAIYNPKFQAKQSKAKFDRILRFAEALPRLRQTIETDLAERKLGKEKVLACIVKLIDEAYFRVGNEQYAQENNSYGITTLRSKHTDVKGNTVIFDFIGKSGKHHVKEITDRQVAGIIKRLDELPGYEIFRYQDEDGSLHDLHSNDVNEYIKQHMGDEFSAKDFRTWGGTLLATAEFLACEKTDDEAERNKIVVQTVKNVAERLGNTPAVTRGSYIDPRVIKAFAESSDIDDLREAMKQMRPKRYLSRDEQCVLKLLQSEK